MRHGGEESASASRTPARAQAPGGRQAQGSGREETGTEACGRQGRWVESDLLPFQARLLVAPYLELATPTGWAALALDRANLTLRYLHRSSRVADPAGLLVLDAQNERRSTLQAVLNYLEILKMAGLVEW